MKGKFVLKDRQRKRKLLVIETNVVLENADGAQLTFKVTWIYLN